LADGMYDRNKNFRLDATVFLANNVVYNDNANLTLVNPKVS